MYELRQAGDLNVSPNVLTFGSEISAWVSSKSRLGQNELQLILNA
jgi:hypothetical protein